MWQDGLIVVTLLHIHSHSSAARTNNHVSLGVNISIDTPSISIENYDDYCPEEVKCKGQNRIVGGCQVEANTFPWQAYLGCGGTILCPTLIMTAAHCIEKCEPDNCCTPNCCLRKPASDVDVWVGKHLRRYGDGKKYKVKRITPHPNYAFKDCGPNRFDYDFAILELARPINLGTGTKAAAVYLPDPSDPPRDANLVNSGWGYRKKIADYYGDDSDLICRPEALNAVKLAEITKFCRKFYSKFNEDIMVCVGSKDYPELPGKGSCSGDSGGPLVWLDKSTDKVKLIGVNSYGNGQECTKTPSVHGRMTSILNNWQIGDRNVAEELKRCNAKACRAGQCMKGSDLDQFVKSRFFD